MAAQLLELIKSDNADGIKALVDSTPPSDRQALFACNAVSKETPLHVAVALKNSRIVALLLQLGGTPSEFDTDGWSPLHSAIMRRCPSELIAAFLSFKTLLDLPSPPDTVYAGYSPLHCAAFQKDEKAVQQLLAAGANPSSAAANLETPLHVASSGGSCITQLLKAGARVNAANQRGVTPLMEAAAKERLVSVENLITHAEINLAQVDVNGDTALHHAFNVQLQKLFGDNWPIREDAQRIAYLLARYGAPLDAKNSAGITALKYATPSFAKVLRAVSTNRKLAEALPTLDDAMTAGQVQLSGILDEKEMKEFCGAAALAKLEQTKVMEEENAKGACPFLNARKPKTVEVADDESDESDDEADVEARVKNATPEQISACPFLQSKHAAAAKGPNTDATAPRGTCPIPFHRQLMNPYVWLGAVALLALTVGLTKLRSRNSTSTA